MTLANGHLKSKSGYLPLEVLSAIFQECLEPDELECVTPDPLQAPLVLTWVCRLWREIALNTHRLWAGALFMQETSRIEDSRKLLELWTERSGALPIGMRFATVIREGEPALSLMGAPDEDSPHSGAIKSFIETALKCRKRWRVLEFVLPEMSLATPLLQAITEDARALEHFCISLQYLGLNQDPSEYDFSQNSALQSVRLVTPLILPLPTGNSETFANLTVLELHFCASMQDVITWIDMAPNLEHLVVRFFVTGVRRISPEARYVRRLPCLETLELICYATNVDAEDPGLLLDMLETPELVDLEIELSHLFDSPEWPHVKNLLMRSEASLQSLSISGTPMSDQEVIECLRLSPELESFVCEIATDGILRALTPRLISEDSENSSGSNSAPVLEEERMSTDPTEPPPAEGTTTGDNNDPNSNSPDASKYTVLCPNLDYFETSDVDGCSLQVLYAMMNSRCGEVYKDLIGYVDTSSVQPTPEEFKTLESVVLPCDPLFSTLSHPQILESLERTVYF